MVLAQFAKLFLNFYNIRMLLRKILRIELIILSLLSALCLVFFYFAGLLPDHSLSISSGSKNYYTIGYYFSSVLAEVSYYIGPWIVIPTVAYWVVYKIVLSHRQRNSDAFIIFGLILSFFFLTLMVAPKYLGSGLELVSQKYISAYTSFFAFLSIMILTSYLTLRGTFFAILKRVQLILESFGMKLMRYAHQGVNKLKRTKGFKKIKINKNEIKNRAVALLKENPVEEYEDEYEEVEVTESIVEPHIEDDLEKPQTSNEPTSKKTTKKVKRKKKTFFESKELIDCISESITHSQVEGPDSRYFQAITEAIESKLNEFKVDGKIINILKGPVVDTFELELGSGIKVSKVTGLSDDLGLALSGAPIRVVYPMRGKSTIGIEVPRNPRDFIFLDEVLKSKAFNDTQHRLPIAMGKDAFGAVKVVDLAGMPHMLVAGATGAGKSVFINTLLVSLIIKKSPQDLKLILIDPKQLELALFSNLPHLMLPVLTEPKNSAVSLLWAVEEMERRYTILREMGVKNIEGFNRKIKSCDETLLHRITQYYGDHHEGYKLPYIVIVIDEFADLILSKMGKEIETNVNRLAAKARAAGIHLVVATQRPSTDVVTGIIKANFPTRVSFRVSTGHDSKTILDQYGAEKLLGKGDMLYKHGVDLVRMHSSFVEENEIEGVIQKLGEIPQTFDTDAIDFLENGGEEEYDAGSGSDYVTGTSDDPMYQQALEVVMESGSASASMIQRRLRVGYNRAANIIDEMERNGVVGPAQGSKPRKVIKAN